MHWEALTQRKRASLHDAIRPAWRIEPSELGALRQSRDLTGHVPRLLDRYELEITGSPASTIITRIKEGQWTALEVTRAFCHRAAIAHQLTNCLSEICFTDAENQADKLDQHLAETGRLVGPLHGLPISLKDRFHVNGLDSACGFVSWLGKPKTEEDEGVLVKRLRQLGAVIFVKTNVPMTLLMGETGNNIIGTTVNPYQRELSAGGASGGEGALLGLKGSTIGWGSDLAGSIRIPCSFNDLYGLKPSLGRLPARGMATSLPGLPVAGSVVGPMASDLLTLKLAFKTLLDSSPWKDDCDVLELPWREEQARNIAVRSCQSGEKNGKLVFAVLRGDGSVTPHPPIQRALELVVNALSARGYEVIDWNPPQHEGATKTLFQLFGATGGRDVRAAIEASGEPPMPQISEWYKEEERVELSAGEFWDLNSQRQEYQAEYNRYWNDSHKRTVSKRQVDGVIMPVAATVAVREAEFIYYGYSAIANVLDYTAGSFPVTFVDRAIDGMARPSNAMNEVDQRIWNHYEKETFHGAPVGLQVMGRRLQEEKVLGMMGAIAAALESQESYPRSKRQRVSS